MREGSWGGEAGVHLLYRARMLVSRGHLIYLYFLHIYVCLFFKLSCRILSFLFQLFLSLLACVSLALSLFLSTHTF